MRDYENDRFKGFAYIEFRTRDDLEKALALNGVVSVLSFSLFIGFFMFIDLNAQN